MDTHMHPNPTLATVAGVGSVPLIDLPDEAMPPEATPAAAETARVPRRRAGRLAWLLTGTAALGVLGLIGTGVGVSLYRASYPGQVAANWLTLPQVVSPQNPLGQAAPSATGADAPHMSSTPLPVAARPPRGAYPAQPPAAPPAVPTQSPAPLSAAVPPAVVPGPTPAPAPASGADDLRALKQDAPFAPRAAVPASPAFETQGAPPVPPAAPATQAAPTTPAALPAADPAKLVGKLVAAPMTPQGQVDVINLVTQLADVIAQERQENAELRERLAHLPEDVDHRLAEFERRLSLAEAGTALGHAWVAGKPPAPSVQATGAAAPVPAPLALASPVVAEAPSPAGMAAPVAADVPAGRRYEIRAASPGLAVLGTLDGTPGVVEIAVGDQVPGYGRVNAIAQKGSAWVVQCEHGTIQ